MTLGDHHFHDHDNRHCHDDDDDDDDDELMTLRREKLARRGNGAEHERGTWAGGVSFQAGRHVWGEEGGGGEWGEGGK